jgi:hypothetical protein
MVQRSGARTARAGINGDRIAGSNRIGETGLGRHRSRGAEQEAVPSGTGRAAGSLDQASLLDAPPGVPALLRALAGDMLFREQLEDIWYASRIQVYIDLSRSEGRAKEMAQHLRRESIGF